MAEPAMNDWLMKGTVRFVECKWYQNFPKTSGKFFGFGCPGCQDNTSLLEPSIVVNLECSVVPGVGMFRVS